MLIIGGVLASATQITIAEPPVPPATETTNELNCLYFGSDTLSYSQSWDTISVNPLIYFALNIYAFGNESTNFWGMECAISKRALGDRDSRFRGTQGRPGAIIVVLAMIGAGSIATVGLVRRRLRKGNFRLMPGTLGRTGKSRASSQAPLGQSHSRRDFRRELYSQPESARDLSSGTLSMRSPTRCRCRRRPPPPSLTEARCAKTLTDSLDSRNRKEPSMSRQILFLLTLAIAGFAPISSFAGLTLIVAKYDSPTFSNGGSFSEPGVSESISLTSGVAKDVNLDPAGPTINISFEPGTYSGTATSDITLEGITKSISDDYTYSVTMSGSRGSISLAWAGGPAVDFDLGNGVEVTVTPIDSNNEREAEFLLTGVAAVPEPSSAVLAMMGAGSIAAFGLVRRRR